MYNWWSKRLHRSNTKDPERKYTRWEEDFQLQDPGRLALFEEYLEMGIYPWTRQCQVT
jgi:anoctamin-4